MYTYGYIKEACLAKLDMSNEEAVRLGIFNKFPFYANEAVTQICSSIKAKATFAEFLVFDKKDYANCIRSKFGHVELDELEDIWNTKKCNVEDLPIAPINYQTIWHKYHDDKVVFLGEIVNMPSDFVSFGDDINRRFNCELYVHSTIPEEATDEMWNTMGTNKVMFLKPGKYMISYNARWYTFTPSIDDGVVLDMPADVVDALPSYIVSQCLKVDDEAKANTYKTEFEIFLARMDDNNYRTNKTIHLGGDW